MLAVLYFAFAQSTARPCATTPLFRFIPPHHGAVGSAPSALDPTYDLADQWHRAHVGRLKARPLLRIHALAALAHPCAAKGWSRHPDLEVLGTFPLCLFFAFLDRKSVV